jgi:hypothetical protein
MDTPPLVLALARARETGFTGALILRRPGGEAYTVIVEDGAPVEVEPGPDSLPEGAHRLMADRVRESVLADVLSPEEEGDRDARLKLAGRRLTRILRLTGECVAHPSARVAPPPPARGVEVPTPPASVAPRASLYTKAPLAPSLPRGDDDEAPPPPVATVTPASLQPRATSSSTPPLGPPLPRGNEAAPQPVSSVPPASIQPRASSASTPPLGPALSRGDEKTSSPPSVRPRVSISMPGEATAVDLYAGPRIALPVDLPPRSRTPLPPSFRTPPPLPPSSPPPFDGAPPLSPPPGATRPSGLRRVSLPESIPPPAPPPTPAHADDVTLARESAKARVAQMDFAGAERILTDRVPVASRDAETEAFAIWVRANLQSDLDGPIEQLGRLVASNPRCEHALYYRGLVLKRAGQRKAALRDFVTLAKQNPSHVGALFEIKELRRTSDE